LCAIRDLLFFIATRLEEWIASNNNNNDAETDPLRDRINKIVAAADKISDLLFSDQTPRLSTSYKRNFSSATSINSKKKSGLPPSQLVRGQVLEGALFIPSHDDRVAYFDVLLGNVPATLTEHNIDVTGDSCGQPVTSCITRAKLFFNTALQDPANNVINGETSKWLSNKSSSSLNSLSKMSSDGWHSCQQSGSDIDDSDNCGDNDEDFIQDYAESKCKKQKRNTSDKKSHKEVLEMVTNACAKIQGLTSNVLTRLKVVYIELDETNDAQGTYQKMFAVGKVNQIQFQIPRPGMDLSDGDLIRNFLLGFFVSEEDDEERKRGEEEVVTRDTTIPMVIEGHAEEELTTTTASEDHSRTVIPKQTTIYYDMWLPIEESFPPEPKHLDAFFEWYLDAFETDEEAKRERTRRLEQSRAQFEQLSLLSKMGAFIFQTNPSTFLEYSDYVKRSVLGWTKDQIAKSKGPVVTESRTPQSRPVSKDGVDDEEALARIKAKTAKKEALLILDELRRLQEKSKEYLKYQSFHY